MIVIVYGHGGSGPGHWQRWLEAELEGRGVPVLFPDLPDAEAPRKDAWVAALAEALMSVRDRPVTVVAHSLGCWALDHLLAERGPCGVTAALLVVPPSPYLLFEPAETFFPPPLRVEAWESLADRSLLVGSDDDPFTSPEELEEIARAIGVGHRILKGHGHINLESGHGPWPFALEWLRSAGALDGR
ncbi:alpha/beta hydrolase [Candidatus Binatia bacterium]|nr:alpha/beta hydrolase [Candidatus Binatia bacterium]